MESMESPVATSSVAVGASASASVDATVDVSAFAPVDASEDWIQVSLLLSRIAMPLGIVADGFFPFSHLDSKSFFHPWPCAALADHVGRNDTIGQRGQALVGPGCTLSP